MGSKKLNCSARGLLIMRGTMKHKILFASFVAAVCIPVVTSPAFAISPAISGCTQSYKEVENTTATAINDNGSTTSTVSISGQSGTIIDVDLQTFITHQDNANLDITLSSPAGTTVTITTDNAATLANVFNGTYWDDQADPLGSILFANNPSLGTVTKHSYTTSVVASPLVPEEGLIAFKGEDPNGTWTLKIVDDAATETGNLASWKLRVTTCTTTMATESTTLSNSTLTSVPDAGAAVTSTVSASGLDPSLCGVKLTTNITHDFPGDIEMTLTSPSGTVATVTDDQGATNDDAFAGTIWDSTADLSSTIPYSGNPNIVSDHTYAIDTLATTLTPLESFATFNGENPNGTWTLTVRDDAGADTGDLVSWSLQLTTCQPDADGDGTPDATDKCSGTDTDTNSNSVADCLESDLKPVNVKATRSGNNLTCTFAVQNSGSVAAAASSAQIRFGSASDSLGGLKKTFSVPALAAGAKSSTMTVTKSSGGKRFCRFVADSADALTETNENNNSKWKQAR